MNKDREKELELVKSIKEGNRESWKQFVSTYTGIIFSAIKQWCQPYCRKSSMEYLCPWNLLNAKSNVVSRLDTCEEVMDMYLFSLEELRGRVIKFRGESKLSTFIVASMKYIKMDYFRDKYGRLQIPQPIKDAPPIVQSVYKLLCRGKEKEDIGGALNISVEEVKKIEYNIRRDLREKGQEWKHLDGWVALKHEPQPLIVESEDDSTDQTPPYFDSSPEEIEVASYLMEALKILSPVQKRIVQLRFQKGYSVEEIVSLMKEMKSLNLSAKQVYNELNQAVTLLSQHIKGKYDLDNKISNEIKKCVKELLEKLMILSKGRNTDQFSA